MKVEIWSDVACPFCYIGKRRFEEALGQFPDNHRKVYSGHISHRLELIFGIDKLSHSSSFNSLAA
jgi:predicted DsbA family dithiol-disulfide isomerase